MSVSDSKITRSYNQEEIQQILHLAISRQNYEGEFTREQLLEIAAELEIPPENLALAEQEWLAQQGEIEKRQAFNTYRRGRLQKSFGKFAIVNTFLVLLNLVSAGQITWSLYILLFWGLGLGLNTWNTFLLQGEEYERAFQQWYRNHQLRTSVSSFFNKLLKAW
ncbi:2TM domain-containing protein [Aerosakkonema sp. BLCC-F183]|uniref:2TM domain-containing protein n=1 Tax=Aerosakkonema sp. BLCC-F183 TaxID=3342834 RepID=UPI0035B95EE5